MDVSMANKYEHARADALRERYLATFGRDEIPVPVEAIAEDLLGLCIEEAELGDCSGMLLPALGSPAPQATDCRAQDMANDVERAVEREANVFASELLMPEAAVRIAWDETETPSYEVRLSAAASRLEVSPSAMGWRLFNLRLIEERVV